MRKTRIYCIRIFRKSIFHNSPVLFLPARLLQQTGHFLFVILIIETVKIHTKSVLFLAFDIV